MSVLNSALLRGLGCWE